MKGNFTYHMDIDKEFDLGQKFGMKYVKIRLYQLTGPRFHTG
jgi:hypothetical protein